jgi:hypothetical protein
MTRPIHVQQRRSYRAGAVYGDPQRGPQSDLSLHDGDFGRGGIRTRCGESYTPSPTNQHSWEAL